MSRWGPYDALADLLTLPISPVGDQRLKSRLKCKAVKKRRFKLTLYRGVVRNVIHFKIHVRTQSYLISVLIQEEVFESSSKLM